MKTYFEIVPNSFYEEDCSMVCEMSYEGVSFAIKHDRDQRFIGLGVYHFDKSRPLVGYPIALDILINSRPFLNRKYHKISLVYSVKESVLIPFALYNRNTAANAVSLLYGDVDNREKVMTDVISESQYFNCFRVNNRVTEVLENHYPDAAQWHLYSSLVGSNKNSEAKLNVIFYSYKIIVAMYLNGRCMIVNTFPYQSAQDVSYYLLSVRNIFGLADVDLEVSGFIEQESSLYHELYKYFSKISFESLPEFCEFSEDIKQYPAHYFSHLFALDACG